MKVSKIKDDLKSLPVNELNEKIMLLRRELFNLKLNATTAHVKDYSRFKELRKDIARALTYLGQKESSKVK